jgi:hypothetical protein
LTATALLNVPQLRFVARTGLAHIKGHLEWKRRHSRYADRQGGFPRSDAAHYADRLRPLFQDLFLFENIRPAWLEAEITKIWDAGGAGVRAEEMEDFKAFVKEVGGDEASNLRTIVDELALCIIPIG